MTRPDIKTSPSAAALLEEARALYRAGRFVEGERFTAAAVQAHPDSAELWNIRGVMLRQLKRGRDALAALEHAVGVDSGYVGARVNLGNVLLDLGDPGRAEALFAALVAVEPGAAIHRLGLGRALLALGRRDLAVAQLRTAVSLDSSLAGGWLQLARALSFDDPAASDAVLAEALARNPQDEVLMEGKAVLLRDAGRRQEAESFLREVIARSPTLAWAPLQLGGILAERDGARGEMFLRRALDLDPTGVDPLTALAQCLARTSGAREGEALDEAHCLATRAITARGLTPNQLKIVRDVFSRVCDLARIDSLGSFREVGRRWADAGLHTALFRHLPRVQTQADRFELLEQHRICGRLMAAEAERHPIRRPASRRPGSRIRLGFLSADLRSHPVGYFVEPLFEHLERERFDLFCYALDPGPPDELQARFAAAATVFRRLADHSARDIAQTIADDDLDLLIELGGSTHMNKLEVLAWRPAPLQASWLGYPHSEGLPEIGGLVTDPWNTPPNRDLLLEQPWVMPRTWIALGATAFSDAYAIDPRPPEERQDVLTFGTANNPYKYTRGALRAWARITAAVPGARFCFLRPESASSVFRENVTAAFAEEGVGIERIVFRAVRGAHMAHYNEIDITLDTFPLTGGTTTVEALWMGAPVVSLRGEAFYERLSASILTNAGLADLIADDLHAYHAAALALAADRPRRAELRTSLRERLRAGPLGDTGAYAVEFYDLIERRVRSTSRG